MSLDPRTALEQLTSALAEHLNAVAARRGDEDPRVDEAYERIASTFSDYEDALWDAHSEATPLDLYVEDEDDDEVDTDGEDDTETDAD